MIAQNSNSMEATVHALIGYELILVTNLQTAKQHVLEDLDLFVIGIHFDESRAIDLVTSIRHKGKHKMTPIILIRFMPTTLGDSLKSIASALIKVGNINEYLELEDDPDADRKLRHHVTALLPIERALAP